MKLKAIKLEKQPSLGVRVRAILSALPDDEVLTVKELGDKLGLVLAGGAPLRRLKDEVGQGYYERLNNPVLLVFGNPHVIQRIREAKRG